MLFTNISLEIIKNLDENMATLIADENFKWVHQQQLLREEEVWLKNGEGIFTKHTQYRAIAHTKETVEV